MGTKEDWEEIEKTQRKIENEMQKQYGIDITKLAKDTEKTQKRVRKSNKFLDKLLKILFSIIILGEIFFILTLIGVWANTRKNMKSQIDMNSKSDAIFAE